MVVLLHRPSHADMCRFGVESMIYPNLTASLTGIHAGFYTQTDIKNLVRNTATRAPSLPLSMFFLSFFHRLLSPSLFPALHSLVERCNRVLRYALFICLPP